MREEIGSYPMVLDVADYFEPASIGASLAKLWTAKGCLLEPALDASGLAYACPLSSEPVSSPVLLGDGKVYEEAHILASLREQGDAPGGIAESATAWQVLRLAPWCEAIEQFLCDSNVGYYPSEQLEQAMGEAEMPGKTEIARLHRLETVVKQAKIEYSALEERLEEASGLLSRLQSKLEVVQTRAATQLQCTARRFLQRPLEPSLSANSRVPCGHPPPPEEVLPSDAEKDYAMHSNVPTTQKQALQLTDVAEDRLLAAIRIQEWWRYSRKLLMKKAKRKRLRQQRKENCRKQVEASTPSTVSTAQGDQSSTSSTPSSEATAALGRLGSDKAKAAIEAMQLQGVVQQFAQVQEKEKRAILDFVLNQISYDKKNRHKMLIFAATDQRAAGLRNVLKMSPSVEFPLLFIQQECEELARFRCLPDSVGIISESAFATNIDLGHVDMVINFDMPTCADHYLLRLVRAKAGATTMSFPTTVCEVDVIRQVEKRYGVKFRDIRGLAKFKLTENRKALKRRLAASGSHRQKVM